LPRRTTQFTEQLQDSLVLGGSLDYEPVEEQIELEYRVDRALNILNVFGIVYEGREADEFS